MSPIVGYPGPPGSHSGAAATAIAPERTELVALSSFTAVIEAASAAEITLGVLPIESSLIGPIAETHDLLYRAPLSIVREITLPIRHSVLGLPGAKLESVTSVWSHPAAFDQCRDLFSDWNVKCVPAATTADAARHVSETGDPAHVAIASTEAADEYGLTVIADDVGDSPGAFTRFVAVAPYTQVAGGDGWRTALSFVTDHQPGALYRALGAFARNEVNLVQLVSRPLPNSPWRYRFDVVLDGHVFDSSVRPALLELGGMTREVRLFGSYAKERTQ
ncbi:MAG TPA: prephenate dehydratase domain-containing protein [Gaiellaceae bacterium]|jgi:prephenate dehydratase|nr:prephenate dehydratase domain-containing protein [Gaiellaceae bacterium]